MRVLTELPSNSKLSERLVVALRKNAERIDSIPTPQKGSVTLYFQGRSNIGITIKEIKSKT